MNSFLFDDYLICFLVDELITQIFLSNCLKFLFVSC